MLRRGAAKKVTIYVNEDARYHHGPLYQAILEYLMGKGVAGATATRAMAGFGAHRTLHTTKIEVLSEHLPVRIEFVDTGEKVDSVMPGLYDMVGDGVIEVQDTTVMKAAAAESPGPAALHQRDARPARMLRIFLGEADRWEGEPLYDAIVRKLRLMEISGATVYRGIYGYGAQGHEHRASFLHLSRDLPVMIAAVDAPEKLERAAEAIEAMMSGGLIVISDVEMVRLVRGAPPPPEE